MQPDEIAVSVIKPELEQEKHEIEIENPERDTPLRRFITILFEPHFKVLILATAFLSINCAILDFTYQIEIKEFIYAIDDELSAEDILFFLDVFYFLDSLLMLLYKKMNWFEMQVLHPPTKTPLIIIDFISLIPLDAIYRAVSTVDSMYIIVSLRLRYVLRTIRLFVAIRVRGKTVGGNIFLGILMEYTFVLFLTFFFSTGIVYLLVCRDTVCTQNDRRIYLKWLSDMAGKVTGRIFHTNETIKIQILYVAMITNLIMYIYLKGFIIAKFISAFKQYNLPHCLYSNKATIMYKRYKHLFRSDRLLKTTVTAYYRSFWETRSGIVNVNVHGILTEIRQSEIKLDLSWKFFQHSHLFRGEEFHYLHHLSYFVQNTFKSAGEVLYKKGETKKHMIYVAFGTIQCFSDEDGETPVLTFTSGTCLGETSLIIRSRSACTVVCKTDCEIDVLETRDFLNIKKKYPERYEKAKRMVYERIQEAQNFHKVKAFHRDLMNVRETSQLLSMKWIKMMLNSLLSTDSSYFETYIRSLTLEERLLARKLTKLLFCPNYLDLLVLEKQIEYVGDRIFVKPTFPCILQPNCYLVRIWRTFIAIAVLVYIFVYPLYMAFYQHMSGTYLTFVTIITLLWALDIFIQISTAIQTSDRLIATMEEITSMRLSDSLFILDIIAVIPLEVLTVLISRHTYHPSLILLQINRAFKLFRIQDLFKKDKHAIHTNVMFISCIKSVLYLIILIYWLGAFIYLFTLFDETNNVYHIFFEHVGANTEARNLAVCFFLATVLVTGYNVYLPDLDDPAELYYIPMILIAFTSTLLYFIFFSMITSTESIRVYHHLVLQEYYKDVKFILKSLNFDQYFLHRIQCYTNHQWLATKGIQFLERNQLLKDMPRELYLIIRRSSLADYVENIALFQNIPSRLLTEYCGSFTYWDIPAGQIITYAGEIANELYIINNGYCEVISADGHMRRTITQGDSFAVLETCLNIPIVHNVIALTDCSLISLTYNDFIRATSGYPELLDDFKQLAKETLNNWTQHALLEHEQINVDVTKIEKENSSFVKFGYFLDYYSDRGMEYHLPFENLGYFAFLRYFLLRYTIRCTGKFIRYYEIFRCFISFFFIVLSVIPYVAVCYNCVFYYIRYALDIFCIFDMYLRHHVTYYNNYGIEVTHPMKTAVHYWKTSLIIDFLNAIPIVRITEAIIGRRINKPVLRLILRTNKMLGAYHIIQGLNYVRNSINAKLKFWTVFMFIPPLWLTFIFSAGFVFNQHCRYSSSFQPSELFSTRIVCKNDSWIVVSDYDKPISLARAIAYHVYYCLTLGTTIAVHGFYINNFVSVLLATGACFIGFIVFEYTCAKIVAINLTRNVKLTVYQEATAVLKRFLRIREIDQKLTHELIEHFEYTFFKLRGISYDTVFNKYHHALKEEAMYKIFGSVMKESYVFHDASPSFFRSLLLHAKHQIILRRGIISRVNDISDNIFFLFKGEVEVLGPDYNRLVILPKGSLFGNLDEVICSRRTLTMVARGHVELLEIQTKEFYTVLNRYGKLKLQFRKMTMVNVDYLPGGPLPEIIQAPIETKKQEEKMKDWKSIRLTHQIPVMVKILRKLITVHRNTKMMQIWDAFILIVVCFLGFIFEFYRITMTDSAIPLTIVMYIFDLFYIIRIYLKFHLSFVNDTGACIKSRRAIAKNYIKSRTGFAIDITTVIPIEIIAFAFYHNGYIFWRLLIYLRFNRFLRLFFVGLYFHRVNQKISINVYRVKALQMLVFTLIILQLATTILIGLGCVEDSNTYPPMKCDFSNLTSLQKFQYFIRQLSNVVSIFAGTSFRKYYPNSFTMIIVLSLYMFVCRISMMLFMAEICATWEVIQHTRHVYEQTIIKYKKLVTAQRLSPVLIDKTWRYFQILWGKRSGLQFPTLLEEAPYYLREAVLHSMFGDHLNNHPTLKRCHIDLIRQMAARMRTRFFFPGDYIAYKGDIDDCMYFVHDGEILGLSLDTLKTEEVDIVYRAGDMFGLKQGMYPKIGHEFSYRANQYTILVVLRRMDWIHLLDFYPASKVLIYDESLLK